MLNAILESFLSILHVGRNVKYVGPVIRWREEEKKKTKALASLLCLHVLCHHRFGFYLALSWTCRINDSDGWSFFFLNCRSTTSNSSRVKSLHLSLPFDVAAKEARGKREF